MITIYFKPMTLYERLSPEQVEKVELYAKDYPYSTENLIKGLSENDHVDHLTVLQFSILCHALDMKQDLNSLYELFKTNKTYVL